MGYLIPPFSLLPLWETKFFRTHAPEYRSSLPTQRLNKSPATSPALIQCFLACRLPPKPFGSLLARAEANQTAHISPPTRPPPPPSAADSPAELVRRFYEGINRHDLESVEELIADNCVYEDLIFPRPFVGRKAILDFFKKFTDSVSTDLQFVIDDISGDDSSAVGVTWHLEWKGKPFPFSKGCSFYRCGVINGKRKITYGRDSVEPAVKPGELALSAIRGVNLLLQQFPQLADRW